MFACLTALVLAVEPVPTDEVDLSITFHPELSGQLGWVRLPTPVPLHSFGDVGAKVVSLSGDPMLSRAREAQLAATDWANTAVTFDRGADLCSPQLKAAVTRATPRRLLISTEDGLTPARVACLAALPVERLYVTGCLYRAHRPDSTCDGDAELAALAAVPALHSRLRGLAVSESKKAAVDALGSFTQLEYLAIVSGRDATAGLADLPFSALTHVRYLDVLSWNTETHSPAEIRFLSRLHTLRWRGEFFAPAPKGCALARVGGSALTEHDLACLAECSDLIELQSDAPRFTSATAVARFKRLERLSLRHWEASSLAPLATLQQLQDLMLSGARARDFGALAALKRLQRLDLSHTALTDLRPLAPLTKLEELTVSFTAVKTLEPLAAFTGLRRLEVAQTQVRDVSPVAKLDALQELFISNTPVASLAPLARHPALEWLVLYDTQVQDIAVLSTLPKLRRVNVGGLKLPDAQLAALRERLPRGVDGL